MTKRVTLHEAQTEFDALLGALDSEKRVVIVDAHDRPRAVLITVEEFAYYQGLTAKRFAEAVEAIRRDNADVDPDEVYREVTAAVEEVRQENYERTRRD